MEKKIINNNVFFSMFSVFYSQNRKSLLEVTKNKEDNHENSNIGEVVNENDNDKDNEGVIIDKGCSLINDLVE